MIPAARSAYLNHVYRELLETDCQHHQLFSGARRARYRTQMIPEDPRHQRELLFPADWAHYGAGFPVKLRRPQQIRVGVTDFGHARASRVHFGQQ